MRIKKKKGGRSIISSCNRHNSTWLTRYRNSRPPLLFIARKNKIKHLIIETVAWVSRYFLLALYILPDWARRVLIVQSGIKFSQYRRAISKPVIKYRTTSLFRWPHKTGDKPFIFRYLMIIANILKTFPRWCGRVCLYELANIFVIWALLVKFGFKCIPCRRPIFKPVRKLRLIGSIFGDLLRMVRAIYSKTRQYWQYLVNLCKWFG